MSPSELHRLGSASGIRDVPKYVPLPPELDPMVQFKLQKMHDKRMRKKSKTSLKSHEDLDVDLEALQKAIHLGLTPSGRKLNTYSSDSGEECVYRKVECKDDPEFDLIYPCFELGPREGQWPNPYLFYWNWKEATKDEPVDELYIRPEAEKEIDRLRRDIALKLEEDMMSIPYYRIGLDDTDASDAEEMKIFSRARNYKKEVMSQKMKEGKGQGDKKDKESLTAFRKHHWKYSEWNMIKSSASRNWFAFRRKLKGQYTSGRCTCTKHPLWYVIWKKIIRRIKKKLPKEKKSSKKTSETLFYGTMASLHNTQYIVEYNLLPNMDDPVGLSQIALERAMASSGYLRIKTKFLVKPKNGKPYVDYLKLQMSTSYERYLDVISLLCRFQPVKMPPRARKVFFINYFNVLSIQTQIWRITEKQNMRYLWEMKNFWERTKGLCGYVELSLEEIYHGILRCNKPHPQKQKKIFTESSTKGKPKEISLTRLALDHLDPRIHFALNVGCKSSPPIQVFSLYEQDCQLDEVARTYVRKNVKIDENLRLVTLPILFLWYEKDFGNNQRILLWYLKRFFLAKDMLKIRRLVTSKRAIIFRYERFNYELDHIVRRHQDSKCAFAVIHKKIVPVYWSSRI